MNQTMKNQISIAAALGGVLLALRLLLYVLTVDDKNLLLSGHWMSLLTWGVAALALAYVLMAAFRAKESESIFVSGTAAALGEGLFGGVLLLCTIALEQPVTLLEKLLMLLGYVSAAGLLFGAYCRAVKKPAFFGCYCAVCVFFALYLVNIYREWSANPQLMDYVFALLACVSLTLLAYQNAALAVGLGSRRGWLAAGLTAICFGLGAVCGAESVLLYIGGAVWALTNLLGADAAPRNRYEKEET